MTTSLTEVRSSVSAELQEKVLLGGDLARLTPAERLSYYNAICATVGLNPLTRPFEYLILNGKMTLYARKDCTDQLRNKAEISIQIVGRELVEGVYVVTAQAKNIVGRTDESIGAVPLPAAPADKANGMMKAETKAKRRVTLSFCGLGILDETELDTVPQARVESFTCETSHDANSWTPPPAPRGASAGEATAPNYGPYAKQPLSSIPNDSLQEYLVGVTRSVHDEKKVTFKGKNLSMVAAIKAELQTRGASVPAVIAVSTEVASLPPTADAVEPQLDAVNICQQFRLSESMAELVSVMDRWQSEATLHTSEEHGQVSRVFAEQKKRLGKG